MTEPDPSPDDLLELARAGADISRPDDAGPAIGGQHTVQEERPPAPGVRQVWQCLTCKGALVANPHGIIHGGHSVTPISAEEWESVGVDYFDRLDSAIHEKRFHKWLEWGPNEWRQIPGFPSYEMNGYYREIRRRASTRKDGTVKPARPVTARKSSVTLSQDGEVSSHGIEKLWQRTFPEYVIREESWQVHSLRREGTPEGFGRVVKTGW